MWIGHTPLTWSMGSQIIASVGSFSQTPPPRHFQREQRDTQSNTECRGLALETGTALGSESHLRHKHRLAEGSRQPSTTPSNRRPMKAGPIPPKHGKGPLRRQGTQTARGTRNARAARKQTPRERDSLVISTAALGFLQARLGAGRAKPHAASGPGRTAQNQNLP